MRAVAFGLAGGCLLGTSLAAAGEHARLALSRDAGAETCPDEKILSDAVAARLGYEPFADDAPLSVSVRFARGDDGWHGTVEMRGAQGEEKGSRTLTSGGSECQELAEATALTISILLDPRSGLGPRPPRPPEPPTPRELPDLVRRSDPTSLPRPEPGEAPPRRARPFGLQASAHFIGTVNLLPSADWGVLVGVTAESGPWSLGLEARFDAPASRVAAGAQVTASFIGGAVVPCARWSVLRGCLVASLGAVDTRVEGTNPGSRFGFLALFGPRFGASAKLTSWLALDAHADLLFSPTPVTVAVDGADAWSSGVVSGLLAGGLVGSFL